MDTRKIILYLIQNNLKIFFVGMENYHVITIPDIVCLFQILFYPMIKPVEVDVAKILAEIVAYRDVGGAARAPDNLFQYPEGVWTFYFAFNQIDQDIVVD